MMKRIEWKDRELLCRNIFEMEIMQSVIRCTPAVGVGALRLPSAAHPVRGFVTSADARAPSDL